jgi:hypothetical protein
MVGEVTGVLPDVPRPDADLEAAVTRIVRAAAQQVGRELIDPPRAGSPPEESDPAARAAARVAPSAAPWGAARDGDSGGAAEAPVAVLPVEPEALLTLLAERRLSDAPDGEPWRALQRAVRDDVSPPLRLLLAAAQDPLSTVAEAAAERLGVGLADAARRVEASPALRRAAVADVERTVFAASDGDAALGGIAHVLLAPLTGGPPDPERAAAAELIFEQARAGHAAGPEDLARLLVALRAWPERRVELLRAALTGVAPGTVAPPAPPAGPGSH